LNIVGAIGLIVDPTAGFRVTFRRGMERFHAIHHGRMLEMRLQRDVRIP
jgi:hypothetical protein